MPNMSRDDEDRTRSLWNPQLRELCAAMPYLLHMAPRRDHALALRKHGSIEVPDFDPVNGSINAKALFLMEKPVPMIARVIVDE